MPHPDTIIVGAGITGVTAALELAKNGAHVEVIERYQPAAMASGWTLAGVRQSGRHSAELPLAKAAIKIWKTLDETLGAKTGYNQSGNLRLARNPEEIITIKKLVETQSLEGLKIELLDRKEICNLAPFISSDIECASFCEGDGQADPIATIKGYKNAAEKLGVVFRNGISVQQIITNSKFPDRPANGSFRSVLSNQGELFSGSCILATGFQTNELLKTLGRKIPLTAPIVGVAQTIPLKTLLKPVIGVANADLAIKQKKNGELVFTSGLERLKVDLVKQNGLPQVLLPKQLITETFQRLNKILPTVNRSKINRTWGGVIDLTPDGLPVIDRVPNIKNLIVASGFSGHGFGIAPIVGRLLANLVLCQPPSLPIEAFQFKRFKNEEINNDVKPSLYG